VQTAEMPSAVAVIAYTNIFVVMSEIGILEHSRSLKLLRLVNSFVTVIQVKLLTLMPKSVLIDGGAKVVIF
jgi:hypothetical protein